MKSIQSAAGINANESPKYGSNYLHKFTNSIFENSKPIWFVVGFCVYQV
jgi:hypothetical protein